MERLGGLGRPEKVGLRDLAIAVQSASCTHRMLVLARCRDDCADRSAREKSRGDVDRLISRSEMSTKRGVPKRSLGTRKWHIQLSPDCQSSIICSRVSFSSNLAQTDSPPS